MDENKSLNKVKYKVETQERCVKEEKKSVRTKEGRGISQIWEGEKNLV